MKIKVLPDNLANQIAAGEVVERPASVIKELVENSIDAGAARVQIDVELGGRRLMRVSDDGCGMLRDDAVLAFERHATSKISTLEDLAAIGTLGFRGEALASIASVSKAELVTKVEEEDAATRVCVEGGRLIDIKDAARSRGTTISVRELFYNTPARRKFMRSEPTENYHLTGIVTHYSLAHPEIAFTFTSNGREVLRVAPAKDLRERAFQIFGAGLLDSLLPVSGGRDHVARVSGFISAPRERRTTRDAQYFFVNQRFVRDKTIAGGLMEGYRSVLPHGVYPVAFLFVDVPLEEIDVNVHPAKTEVRFRRTEAVKDAIAEAIRNSLASAGIAVRTDMPAEKSEAVLEEPPIRDAVAPSLQSHIEFHPAATAAAAAPAEVALRAEAPAPALGAREAIVNEEDPSVSGLEAAAAGFISDAASRAPEPGDLRDTGSEEKAPSFDSVLPPVNSGARLVKQVDLEDVSRLGIRPIAQLHDSFIIAVDQQGMLLIDQHVAHERILFDKFRKSETDRPIESQNLLLPETIDLTPAQSQAFHVIEDELATLGFGLMRLSGRTVALKSIPTDLAPGEARNLFAEILDHVELDKRGQAKQTLRDDIAASLACKAAVKINMKLTHEKMQWLIDRLLTTSSPTTCPHGRPVILRITMKDIERGFHRT